MSKLTKNDLNVVVNAAMIDPAFGFQTLERMNNDVCGKATDGKATLDLPRCYDERDLKLTESWGFKWPEDRMMKRHMVRSDDLTVPVIVPEGWSITPSDHWLYKHLKDPKGQVRGQLMLHYQDHDAWFQAYGEKYRSTGWQKIWGEAHPARPAIKDTNGTIVWMGDEVIPARPTHGQDYRDYCRRTVNHPGYGHSEDWKAGAPKTPSQAADAIAEKFLDQLKAKYPEGTDFFETPIEFPAFNMPVLIEYRLRTEYYHPGSNYASDSGSEILKLENDEEAIALVQERFSRSFGYHVVATLRREDKVIFSKDDRQRARAAHSLDMLGKYRYGCDLFPPNFNTQHV